MLFFTKEKKRERKCEVCKLTMISHEYKITRIFCPGFTLSIHDSSITKCTTNM